MLKFKQFIQQEDIPVFCNAGGRKGQYDKFTYNGHHNPASKEVIGFCHAGGPPPQQQEEYIEENLNPRINPVLINSSESVLTDPEKNNKGLGEDRNHPANFLPDVHGTGHVDSNFTDEQAKNARALSSNTNDDHEDYHAIITPYTQNSYNLNNTLYSHHIKGIQHPRIIKSHLDYESDEDEEDGSEIDVEKLDRLISSHRLPHAMTVYTGMHFHPNEHRGRIHINPPYMSTSLSPNIAKDFGKWYETHQSHDGEYKQVKIKNILRLHLPKGHEHVFTDNGSIFPGQGELILPRNTRFQYGQRPTHIIRGNFDSHFFGRGRKENVEYHFYTGRVLPRK